MDVVVTGGYVEIPAEDMEVVRSILTTIDQQQLQTQALHLLLTQFIQRKTGIDLAAESWNLDAQRGILTPNTVPFTEEHN